MKVEGIIRIGFLLGTILWGQAWASADGPEIFGYSNGDPVSGRDIVTKLDRYHSIRRTADSWPALVAKSNPTFAWNEGDAMWIENAPDGNPVFTLDEAYRFQAAHQPVQWIFVKAVKPAADAPDDLAAKFETRSQFENYIRSAVIAPSSDRPSPNDGGDYGNYAVIIARNPSVGVVYEIGWQEEMGDGTGHPIYARRIYLLKDVSARWRFLGEGPEEGSCKGSWSRSQVQVTWESPSSSQYLPLQIRFVSEITDGPYRPSEYRPDGEFISYEENVLAGDFPAKLRSLTGHPYTLTTPHETFEQVVALCTDWSLDWEYDPQNADDRARRKNLWQAWRAALRQLNPQRPEVGPIKEGTHVAVLNHGEIFDRVEALAKAQKPSEGATQPPSRQAQ
jgi:hypothetical protein